MRAVPFILAAATAVAFSGPAVAQDAERYRLERTESGFVRMDTRTGQMSFCEERSGELACRPAADARTAETDRTGELDRRVEELEARISALESRAQAQLGAGLPSEAEFEQTLSFMERFIRRFWGVAKDLERESEPGRSAPDRT
jgi:hypothetical protein